MTNLPSRDDASRNDASQLVGVVLDEEARREAAQAARRADVVLPDDQLPGVGSAEVPLREALRRDGARTALVVGLLGFVAEFDNAAMTVLAPDIRDTLNISEGVIAVVVVLTSGMFLVGSAPISSLADRYPRKLVTAASVALWTVVVALTGAVRNGFQLALARFGAGIGHSYEIPVTGPLLIDTYAIEARSRIFALTGTMRNLGATFAPLFVGLVASLAGGDSGWRWAFLAIGIVSVPLTFAALTLREPQRGRHEMQAVLGATLDADEGELPISLSVAFERLKKIRSFYFFLTGMAALGFGLLSAGIFLSFYLDDRFGLDAAQRGTFGSLTLLGTLVAVPLAGRHADAVFRRSPPAAMILVGALISLYGALFVAGLWMPNVALLGVFLALATASARAAYAILPAVISTIIPYRLRSRGSALVGIYILLVGGGGGAIITNLFVGAWATRTGLSIVVLPSSVIGGFLISLGARHVRRDISLVVEELVEEQEEHARLHASETATPLLQVRNLDYSYGKVQVLFDIGFEIWPGEVVALLGTNGAGKSTILRAVSGLGVPDRGVVRLGGRTITYSDPEVRARIGVVQLSGGNATFGPLSVADNLDMACFRYDKAETAGRIARVIELFPILDSRRDEPAANLSGGQQQMLALGMALVHDPEILMIDELSLGLAPAVVTELLGVVEQLRADGLTMLVVEQSLNVALAIADRAIFLEKGEIRFTGPAHELAERDDLARAVFLGSSGG